MVTTKASEIHVDPLGLLELFITAVLYPRFVQSSLRNDKGVMILADPIQVNFSVVVAASFLEGIVYGWHGRLLDVVSLLMLR